MIGHSFSIAETPSRRNAACALRPWIVERERDRPGLGRHDVEVGRLGDDGDAAREPGADRGEHPGAAVLLARHREQDRLASELDLRLDQRPQRRQARHDAGLHVACAAAVEQAVVDPRAERRRRPLELVARRRRRRRGPAMMARLPALAVAEPAGHHRVHVARHLDAREVGVARQLGGGDVDALDLEPGRRHPQRHLGLHLALRAGEARIRDDRGQVGGDAVAIDGPDGGQLGRGQVLHPRRIGRVMQVGPPDPLMHTSVPGNVCTSHPRSSSARCVAGLPSTMTTTPGRTARMLQPWLRISSSGTGTSATHRSREQLVQPGGELGHEDHGQVVGDRRDDRQEVQALGGAVGVRDVEDVHIAADQLGHPRRAGHVGAERPADAEHVGPEPERVAAVGGLVVAEPAQHRDVAARRPIRASAPPRPGASACRTAGR